MWLGREREEEIGALAVGMYQSGTAAAYRRDERVPLVLWVQQAERLCCGAH